VLADGVSGWLDGRSEEDNQLRMEARILSAAKNASFTGVFDRSSGRALLDVTAQGCDLDRPSLLLLTRSFLPEAGTMDFSFHAAQAADTVSVTGGLTVRDAAVKLVGSDVRIAGMTVHARLNEREIRLYFGDGGTLGCQTRSFRQTGGFPRSLSSRFP
jgi:hypothetical protein